MSTNKDRVLIPRAMVEAIEDLLARNPEWGYETVEEYVKEAVREKWRRDTQEKSEKNALERTPSLQEAGKPIQEADIHVVSSQEASDDQIARARASKTSLVIGNIREKLRASLKDPEKFTEFKNQIKEGLPSEILSSLNLEVEEDTQGLRHVILSGKHLEIAYITDDGEMVFPDEI